MENDSMSAWVAFAVIGLLAWRVLYAIRTARDGRSMTFRWTDPWIW
jgi:hypothetical protein